MALCRPFATTGWRHVGLGNLPEYGTRSAFVVGEKTHGVLLEFSHYHAKRYAGADSNH